MSINVSGLFSGSARRRTDCRAFSVVVLLAMSVLVGLLGCARVGGEKDTASISVSTAPADAVVSCDGEDYGTAPVTIAGLASGRHLLEVDKEGYRAERVTVNLFEGQKTAQKIELLPMTGLVLIESTPAGAEVTIDEAYKGETPLMISDLQLGNYRVNMYRESYFPRELSLRIRDRVPQHIQTELTSDSAGLNVYSEPSGGSVVVNGASMGRTPSRIDRIKSGEATVEISLDGYLPHQQEVRLRAGEEYNVRAELVPLPSGLTVYSVPDNARVYVDSRFEGETPLTLTNLVVGSYSIRVDKEGYESQERSADLSPGSKRIEEFRLDSNSGQIVLVTEPAGVKVFIDGERVGVTEPSDSDIISNPLEIDLVPQGRHRLQLMREGYVYEPRSIDIDRNEMLTLHEQMQRLFIPDTLVRTGEGSSGTYRGILLRRHPNGDVDLETRPGIIVTIQRDEIQSIESLNRRDARQ